MRDSDECRVDIYDRCSSNNLSMFMINLFNLRDTRTMSTHVLLRAEAEYRNAYGVLASHKTTAAQALRQQLQDALGTLRKELRARGLNPRRPEPVEMSGECLDSAAG